MTYQNAIIHVSSDTLMDTSQTASRRTRQSQRNVRKSQTDISISSDDTVRELKLRIAKVLHFPVSYQILFFQSTCLDDDSATLSHYRIPKGALIQLVQIEETPSLNEESKEIVGVEDKTCFSDSAFFRVSS